MAPTQLRFDEIQFLTDTAGERIKIGGGNSKVFIGHFENKHFALKETSHFCGAEEVIKYRFLKMFDVFVPEAHLLYDRSEKKYYICTEIIPGCAPMGILGICGFFSEIHDVRGCKELYLQWVRSNGIPQDEETLKIYDEMSHLTGQSYKIIGIDNLFIASVFTDDEIPCGKVRVSPIDFAIRRSFSGNPDKLRDLYAEERKLLFGNMLLKPIRKTAGKFCFLLIKIDLDGRFKVPGHYDCFNNRIPWSLAVERFFVTPKEIASRSHDFLDSIGGKTIDTSGLIGFYDPIVSVSPLVQRLNGAMRCASISEAEIVQLVVQEFSKIEPNGEAYSEIGTQAKISKRRQEVIDHLTNKVRRFRDIHVPALKTMMLPLRSDESTVNSLLSREEPTTAPVVTPTVTPIATEGVSLEAKKIDELSGQYNKELNLTEINSVFKKSFL
jgi:hypothetical protein